jgi:hypothetical protein
MTSSVKMFDLSHFRTGLLYTKLAGISRQAVAVHLSSRPGQHLTKIGIGKLYGMSKIPGIQCMSVA